MIQPLLYLFSGGRQILHRHFGPWRRGTLYFKPDFQLVVFFAPRTAPRADGARVVKLGCLEQRRRVALHVVAEVRTILQVANPILRFWPDMPSLFNFYSTNRA